MVSEQSLAEKIIAHPAMIGFAIAAAVFAVVFVSQGWSLPAVMWLSAAVLALGLNALSRHTAAGEQS